MSKISPTFRLFARPSFIEGMARVLDLGATLQTYNKSETPEEADYLALLSDWTATGNDLKFVIKKYERDGTKITG